MKNFIAPVLAALLFAASGGVAGAAELAAKGVQPGPVFVDATEILYLESYPVQVNIVLVHETDEDCEAYWRREYPFNLDPLRARFLEAYGPGVLILNLIDFRGEVHRMEWGIFPPD